MSHVPDYSYSLSLKLSEVLSDIGVNENMVLKRRRLWLLSETLWNISYRLQGQHSSWYKFGSQTEGSTTKGLESDMDVLDCFHFYDVVQDFGEWHPGIKNPLLMIRDETTTPGYCVLQLLREDAPLPVTNYRTDMKAATDRKGRALFKNTFLYLLQPKTRIRNGPALSVQGVPGLLDQDIVLAFHCKSWPKEAQPWLERNGISGWPTEETKRTSANAGCFVVPVCGKGSMHEETEWRISTSFAERCLMLSLNITQIRCYVLMKMILKTFINPQCPNVLSSFMCKTVLFHSVQNTHPNEWQERNIQQCLTRCLSELEKCVLAENCPHFIIPENNLMARRIPASVKNRLLEILQYIIQTEGHILMEIQTDDLGRRLEKKMTPDMRHIRNNQLDPYQISCTVSASLHFLIACDLSQHHQYLLSKVMYGSNEMAQRGLYSTICSLLRTYRLAGIHSLNKLACQLLVWPFLSSLGCAIASNDIGINNNISKEAKVLLTTGFNFDVASGRLKLASAFYCTGNMERTDSILRNIENRYDKNVVEPVCGCHDYKISQQRKGFRTKCNTGNEETIKQSTAFCVRFMQSEMNCVPKELQFEMFRSTPSDLPAREFTDFWMDWAVVDALPYLYFLQYKTFSRLHKVAYKQRALTHIVTTINTEANLGHRETAMHLLGQCMEQEKRYTEALYWYMMSLRIRTRNNAAKIHICRLLNEIVNGHVVQKT